MTSVWEKELYGERTITLVIKNAPSHGKAKEFASVFKADVSGIADAKLIRFRKNSSQYNIKYRGWPDHFANEIQMSYFQNKYFKSKVEEITGNKIIIIITGTN